MNGCHSTLSHNRLQSELIYHSKGNVSWANVFTRDCQYIKQENIVDDGCDGCRENKTKVDSSPVCEECNVAMYHFAHDGISGYRCDSCGWSLDN